MKVAISNLPLKSAHKFRGIGYYTSNLIKALKEDSEVELMEFTNISEVKNVDIVHYPWFDLFFHTLPIKRQFPTVVTIHDVIPLIFAAHYPIGIRAKINLMLQKTALKSCRYIVTDSNISKEDIVKYLKVAREKINVVHLAADEKFKVINNETELLRLKRKHHLPDNFLLYVGDANWVKNLPFLIEGFRQLIQLPDFADMRLILIGRVFVKNVENINHPELASLKLVNQLIKQYGLESKIIRPGQIETDELVDYYNLATAYIQPSFYEGFGLPVIQAFACGTPVICSNKGSLPEIGGDAAIYFDPQNLKQFLTVTSDLLKDTSLQNKLAKLGIKQTEKFSWKKTAEETIAIYLKTIEYE